MLAIFFLVLMVIAAIANFVYWILSLIVMSRTNVLWAIGGFFASPVVQIIFYAMEKNNLSTEDANTFIRFFITIGAVIVLAIMLGMFAGASAV